MIVTLASCFRNSAGYPINRWARQVSRLQDALVARGDRLQLHLVYGDCTDATKEELSNVGLALDTPLALIERSHGGPTYGSTEEPSRFRALSYVGNGVFEQLSETTDALIYVESDLLWQPQVLLRLLDRLTPETPVIAPLIYAGLAFYDIWAFRAVDGTRFGPFHPYSRDLKFNGELTEVGSVGSCLVMLGEVARSAHIIDDECLVGFCRDARQKGYRIFVDAAERVDHP